MKLSYHILDIVPALGWDWIICFWFSRTGQHYKAPKQTWSCLLSSVTYQ